MEFDFTEKTVAELETRKAEIRTEIETEGADLDALEAEARAINAEMETRKAAEAQKVEIRKAVAEGAGTVVEDAPKNEVKKMTIDELRSSQEYNEAYKNYIITGKDSEIRKLISENGLEANGTNDAPVPVIVETTVRTAWERNDIMSRVNRTFFRGNFKAYFELSADPAYVHVEGTSAPTEEALTLGVVTMIPANIKKWITISDEAIAMGGEEFLRYIYDELTYRIVKKLSDLCIADVTGASTSNGASAIGVPKVTAEPGLTTVAVAAANLSEEATNLVVVMNRLTEAEFAAAYAGGNFAVDPYAGLPRVYTSALPAYSTASANAVYAIVGDLSAIQVNYPEGDGVVIKYDDLTLAEADVVKIVGRQYAAHKITRPGRLVNIAKPAAVTT